MKSSGSDFFRAKTKTQSGENDMRAPKKKWHERLNTVVHLVSINSLSRFFNVEHTYQKKRSIEFIAKL